MKERIVKVVLCVCALLMLILAIFLPKATWTYLVELVLAFAMMGILMFGTNEKHNTAKVVLIAFIGLMILSWIIPAAYFSGDYVDQGRAQMGLFDMFNYPLTALSYFGYITLFIILVGGFYGVLYKIPAYRTLLDKITTKKGKVVFSVTVLSILALLLLVSLWATGLKFKSVANLVVILVVIALVALVAFLLKKVENSEKLSLVVLSIMVLAIAALVSVCGLHIGIALLVPFIVALIFMMGYDKITAALVTVGGISAGLIGTTLASSNLSVLTQTLKLSLTYNIWVRVVILAAAILIVIFNVIMYVKRNVSAVKVTRKEVKKTEAKVEVKVKEVKKSTKSSKTTQSSKKKSTKKSSKKKNNNKAALKDGKVIVLTEAETVEAVEADADYVPKSTNEEHSIWPLVTLLSILLVILLLAFISWDADGIGVTLFNGVTKSVTDFTLFGFPIFAKILGTVNAFGSWTLTDMFIPLALTVLLLAFVYRISLEEVLEGFISGAKKALGPAVISILVYGILVLVTYHPFQLVIYNTLLSMNKGFNILTTTVMAILAGMFNSDVAYTFQSVLPYYVTKVTNLKDFSIVGIVFTSMYGLTALFAPTSLVLMGVLSYLKVSYKDWLSSVWKLLLELFIVLLIVFIILAII